MPSLAQLILGHENAVWRDFEHDRPIDSLCNLTLWHIRNDEDVTFEGVRNQMYLGSRHLITRDMARYRYCDQSKTCVPDSHVRPTPRFRRGGRTPNAPAQHLPARPPSPATGCWAAHRHREFSVPVWPGMG